MSVILRNIQIPLFIKIETGCLSSLRKILDEHHLHFQKPLMLSTSHILELGGNAVVSVFLNPATVLVEENTIAQATEIAKEIRSKKNDVVISIGGGRVLDVGKYAATKAQVNYISVPTAPSNDGICSPLAVLRNADGYTESLPVNMPIGILVDTRMLTSAPLENIRAGIGDLISNFSAIEDWRLAYRDGKEAMDDFAASVAFSAAQLIYETCRGVKIDVSSEAFLEKLVRGLILSGIAMNIAGSSRPCSGAEHKISRALDASVPGRSMHGLQVAYGTLLASLLRGQPIDFYIDFFKSVGLPVHHSDMQFSDDELVNALLHASETRTERYTILEKQPVTESSARALLQQLEHILHG